MGSSKKQSRKRRGINSDSDSDLEQDLNDLENDKLTMEEQDSDYDNHFDDDEEEEEEEVEEEGSDDKEEVGEEEDEEEEGGAGEMIDKYKDAEMEDLNKEYINLRNQEQ